MPIKDPALKKNPGIPRAPAGMETDPETGDIRLNDKSTGKTPNPKGKKANAPMYRVVFPNMENRPYSTRPHFAHDWFRRMKVSAIRIGGELVMSDNRARFVTAAFRNQFAADRFALELSKDYYVPLKDIRAYVEKQALQSFDELNTRHVEFTKGNETDIAPDVIVERAFQHWDSDPLQKWQESQGITPETQVMKKDLIKELSNDQAKAQSLQGAVLEAEQGVRKEDQMSQSQEATGSGKLMFDPTQYVKTKDKQPIFKKRTSKQASPEVLREGDTVLVDTGGDLVEGQVHTASPQSALVSVDGTFLQAARDKVYKVTATRVPMDGFPKEALSLGQRVRLEDGTYLQVTAVTGHPGHTKVATMNNSDVRWVPDEHLEVVTRMASLPDMTDEWLRD